MSERFPEAEFSREAMRLDEKVAGLLKGWPTHMVCVIADGSSYRAFIMDRPNKYTEPSSECRSTPEEAIDRLHEILVSKARQRHDEAGDFLGKLLVRIIQKPTPLASTEHGK